MGVSAKARPARKKAGLDIDGTLALFHEAFLKEYNSKYHTNYVLEDFESYHKWRIPVSFEEFMDFHNMIWKEKWREVKPAVSQSTLQSLAKAYEVEILTHRPDDHKPHLEQWLKFYFPKVKLEVRITSNTEVKALARYDILFEDAPPVAEEMIRRGDTKTLLILVNRPWNRTATLEGLTPNIVRVDSLKEGIEMLLGTQPQTNK